MITKAELRDDNERWSNKVVDSMTQLEAVLVFSIGLKENRTVVSCIHTTLSKESLKDILKQMIVALDK